jgi:hypothetical protein
MFQPSERLQAWIRQQLEDQRAVIEGKLGPVNDHPGNWPRRFAVEKDVLLIDGDNVTLWFLSADGCVYSIDLDRYGHPLELLSEERFIRDVLQKASTNFPELRELVEGSSFSDSAPG